VNLKGLDPLTAEELKNWFEKKRREYGLNLAETFLLRHSVCRIAANEMRAQAHNTIDQGWWNPYPREYQLQHIVDWLVADLRDGAPWLGNLDESNRPRKLLKCSSYADLMREANKSMDRRNAQVARALGPSDEETVAEFGNGFTLIEMLTPEALDLESSRLHHCVGHGNYDDRLRTGWGRYLSVRDRKRRPMATIELRREANAKWSVAQIQGKHNSHPPRDAMRALRPYAVEQGWLDGDYFWPTVTTVDDAVYDIDRIPAGTMIRGDMDISVGLIEALGNIDLPNGLTVLGNVIMSPKLRIPENLTVCGFLEIEASSIVIDDDFDGVVLPESLHVDKEIRFRSRGDIARPIPAHLYPVIKVYQDRTRYFGQELLESLGPADEDFDGGAPARGPAC
jgi:hypothetical protein